jgi:hypothetical protein
MGVSVGMDVGVCFECGVWLGWLRCTVHPCVVVTVRWSGGRPCVPSR